MTTKDTRYIEAVGRRKTSVARVRITPASKTNISINDKELEVYFPTVELQKRALAPLSEAGDFSISVKVSGGGISSQADAIKHGIARALTKNKPETRSALKSKGYLKRDPRAKERRKFGLKKARKAPKWSKR